MDERRISHDVLIERLDSLRQLTEGRFEELSRQISGDALRMEVTMGDHEKRLRVLEKAHAWLLGAIAVVQIGALYIYDLLRGGPAK